MLTTGGRPLSPLRRSPCPPERRKGSEEASRDTGAPGGARGAVCRGHGASPRLELSSTWPTSQARRASILGRRSRRSGRFGAGSRRSQRRRGCRPGHRGALRRSRRPHQRGEVYAIYGGGASGTIFLNSSFTGVRWRGAAAFDLFGEALATGDFNGGSVDDLGVGASWAGRTATSTRAPSMSSLASPAPALPRPLQPIRPADPLGRGGRPRRPRRGLRRPGWGRPG